MSNGGKLTGGAGAVGVSLAQAAEAAAVELLRAYPEGLRYSELLALLRAALPGARTGGLHGVVCKLPGRGLGVRRVRRGLYRLDGETAAVRPVGAYCAVERGFYAGFAEFLARTEGCRRCVALGGSRLGAGTPDVIGRCAQPPDCVVPYGDIIVAGELKCDARRIELGFGQAYSFRQFAHKSYLALPRGEEEPVERAAALCQAGGVGLCVFDADRPDAPRFALRLRAALGAPDPVLLNRKLALVRDELWD